MKNGQRLNQRRIFTTSPLLSLLLCLWMICSAFAADLLFPEASGTKEIVSKSVTMDVSHADQGYVMVKHKGSKNRLKVVIIYGDTRVTYDLNSQGEFEVYPLTQGSGKYSIAVYENASTDANSNGYTQVTGKSIEVKMSDPNTAFLYPNTIVRYTRDSAAVKKSQELCAGLSTDEEKLEAIYKYVGKTIVYDFIKAVTVQNQKGYLPDVDVTLSTKMGICYDYAVLMACMLRVQGIPTQVVIGDLLVPGNAQRHAWNNVYINGAWVMRDATFMDRGYKQTDYAPLEVH